jgi:16S rRNA (cytosine1402-N4)-methyltransferase
MPTIHVPVLMEEVLTGLELKPGQTIVDGTLGGGGHSSRIAAAIRPEGRLIAIDRDPQAVARAQELPALANSLLVQSTFDALDEVLAGLNIGAVDGVLLDLGISSDQLADAERGFSYATEGELDMRMNTEEGEPAWSLLQKLPEKAIADLIYEFGEERLSRRIAREIVARRRSQPIRTARELADLVRRCVPRSKNHAIDPATRTFQALRIAVNRELERLEKAIAMIPKLLKPGGKFAVISFHSLEDRIVKHGFREHEMLKVLTKKPIRPSDEEIFANPRSRSSRLRIAERIA